MKVAVAVPCIELVLAIVATIVPLDVSEMEGKAPMLAIFALLLAVGEVLRVVSARGRRRDYHGLTPELAEARSAAREADAAVEGP